MTAYAGRRDIYYWKCDRPAALHPELLHDGGKHGGNFPRLAEQLHEYARRHFPGMALGAASGQGNHHTFLLRGEGETYFVRVENGPEGDTNLDAESLVIQQVAGLGVRVPRVVHTDTSRHELPCAVQVIEYFDLPDLNQWYKQYRLNNNEVAHQIGAAIACWQEIQPDGFGPFDAQVARDQGRLSGYHDFYPAYFFLNLERHLATLESGGFLTSQETREMRGLLQERCGHLDIDRGCLVHKDLALWNILGSENEAQVFIDWDDAIAGDPMDDLSLMACFHEGETLRHLFAGYTAKRTLPAHSNTRFWMHLLRNLIAKSVIRLRGGYFEKDSSFFLIPAGGGSFREETLRRLRDAVRGLREGYDIASLF